VKGQSHQLCPSPSDFHLLGYRKSIIDIDAQISDCALDLGMAEQENPAAEDNPVVGVKSSPAARPVVAKQLRKARGLGEIGIRTRSVALGAPGKASIVKRIVIFDRLSAASRCTILPSPADIDADGDSHI
jgi:hypothetical protein